MKSRLVVDGTGIQKVMKVSMRCAARGCIIITLKLRPPSTQDQEMQFTFGRRADSAMHGTMSRISRQNCARKRERSTALQENLAVTSTP
ncbi:MULTISPECIES: hypothetical protein [Bradyrhizobium]|uniref:hypothetical protein n=1 Tax=Bradyrhizobium TaxID=374 RepID=UPI00067E9054|nr:MULTISPECIES: hypothetical protein [Bradyrhizobium]PAY08904.1 hypothetical protein CK489_10640 [Bradyrhizobium sp. UFLA03-84]